MIADLKKYKKSESDNNREYIMQVLMEVDEASMVDIIRKIKSKKTLEKKKVEKDAKRIYEDGDINKSEMNAYIKTNSPKPTARRTCYRKVKELVEKGFVIKRHKFYSLDDKVKSDIRFLPKWFGDEALASIMHVHYPTVNQLGKNLDELIKIFGSYVLYCFIEASRPAINYDNDLSMNIAEKDKLAIRWVQSVFTPLNMYNYFLAAVKNQPSFDTVQRTLNRNFKETERAEFVYESSNGKERGPPSTQELAIQRFRNVTSGVDNRNPTYELEEETVKELSHSFKKKYPIIYKKLSETKDSFLGRPKQQSLPVNKKKKMPKYFDDDDD